MWYVAQVQAGRESSTLEMCRRLVPPSVMEDCFMPEYEVMWKIRGEWRLVKRLLFPGYLFFVTDDPEALNRELSRVPMPIGSGGIAEKRSPRPDFALLNRRRL